MKMLWRFIVMTVNQVGLEVSQLGAKVQKGQNTYVT